MSAIDLKTLSKTLSAILMNHHYRAKVINLFDGNGHIEGIEHRCIPDRTSVLEESSSSSLETIESWSESRREAIRTTSFQPRIHPLCWSQVCRSRLDGHRRHLQGRLHRSFRQSRQFLRRRLPIPDNRIGVTKLTSCRQSGIQRSRIILNGLPSIDFK